MEHNVKRNFIGNNINDIWSRNKRRHNKNGGDFNSRRGKDLNKKKTQGIVKDSYSNRNRKNNNKCRQPSKGNNNEHKKGRTNSSTLALNQKQRNLRNWQNKLNMTAKARRRKNNGYKNKIKHGVSHAPNNFNQPDSTQSTSMNSERRGSPNTTRPGIKRRNENVGEIHQPSKRQCLRRQDEQLIVDKYSEHKSITSLFYKSPSPKPFFKQSEDEAIFLISKESCSKQIQIPSEIQKNPDLLKHW